MRATMTPEEVGARITARTGNAVSDIRIVLWGEGVKKRPKRSLWLTCDRENLLRVIEEIVSIDFPHLGVVAAADAGEMIDLIYTMQIFFGGEFEEIEINITVHVPKTDPHVPTISGIIPGAVYTEREKQDMIGIIVDGIPDSRRIFLPEDFPMDVYPWRKDEKGIPPSMVRELWKVDRPTDRPAPAVTVAEPENKQEPGNAEPEVPPVKEGKKGGEQE